MMHTVIFKYKFLAKNICRLFLYSALILNSQITAGELIEGGETNVMYNVLQLYGLYSRSSLNYIGAGFIC